MSNSLTNKTRIIAFSGPKTCGKDSAAKALFLQNREQDGASFYFRKAPMAEGVKNICKEMFGYTDEQMEDSFLKETPTLDWPHVAPRWPMMDIANWLRDKYGGDVHVQRWIRKVLNQEEAGRAFGYQYLHVMTDLRFPEELDMLKRYGATIVYIERPSAEEALKAKQDAGDAMALNPSEAHYAQIKKEAHFIIRNDETLESLHNRVLQAVKLTFGHWKYWGVENKGEA